MRLIANFGETGLESESRDARTRPLRRKYDDEITNCGVGI
jgi:hypothetical protein